MCKKGSVGGQAKIGTVPASSQAFDRADFQAASLIPDQLLQGLKQFICPLFPTGRRLIGKSAMRADEYPNLHQREGGRERLIEPPDGAALWKIVLLTAILITCQGTSAAIPVTENITESRGTLHVQPMCSGAVSVAVDKL